MTSQVVVSGTRLIYLDIHMLQEFNFPIPSLSTPTLPASKLYFLRLQFFRPYPNKTPSTSVVHFRLQYIFIQALFSHSFNLFYNSALLICNDLRLKSQTLHKNTSHTCILIKETIPARTKSSRNSYISCTILITTKNFIILQIFSVP